MPIYEYRCRSCQRLSSFLTRSFTAALEPVCRSCGSHDMVRAVSTIARVRSSEDASRMDYYRDPRNIGRHVEDTFKQRGMDLPDSIRQTIDQAREGKMPKEIDPLQG